MDPDRHLYQVQRSIQNKCHDCRVMWESCHKYSNHPHDCVPFEEKWVHCAATSIAPDEAKKYRDCMTEITLYKRPLDKSLHNCPDEYTDLKERVLKFYTVFNSTISESEDLPPLH